MKAVLSARSRSYPGIGAAAATAQSGLPAVASAKAVGDLVQRLDSIAGAGVREDRSVGVVAAVIAFTIDRAAAGSLPWVEEWTFRQNQSLLSFRRSASGGPATELRYDRGGGHFILKRQ